jgi:hypothetical protein
MWAGLNNLGELLAGGQAHDLDISQQSVNAHLMPGRVIAFQNNSDESITSVHQLINSPISLVVNLDNNDFAKGSLFLDQGEKLSELNNWDYEYYHLHVSKKSIQVQFQEGHRGSQTDYTLDSIKILNAEKLRHNSVACFFNGTAQLSPVGLFADYIEEEKALHITTGGKKVNFHNVHSIHFSEPGEFNMCSPEHFRYEIEGGLLPPLKNVSSIDIPLVHMAGVLKPITLTLRVLPGDIVNVKWTWTDYAAAGKRKPYAVPNEYISTEDKVPFGDLSKHVVISASPFTAVFFTSEGDAPTEYFRLDQMVYDEYLNWVKVQVTTEANEKFNGIFGLGERASFDFFYRDGVYSMWSKDIPTPIESGDLPAANMYGTHPYFMYKHKAGAYVGALYKLAAA